MHHVAGSDQCKRWIAVVMVIAMIVLYGCDDDRQGKGLPASQHTPAVQRQNADTLLSQALICIYRFGNEKHDIDSAQLLVHEAEAIDRTLADTCIHARICFCYSNILRDSGQVVRGRRYIDSAIALLRPTTYHDLLGECYLEQSSYYSDNTSTTDMQQKKVCMLKALPEFEKTGAMERQGDVLRTLGDLEQLWGDIPLSMSYLRRALVCYQAIGYKHLYGLYDLLGQDSWIMQDYPTAIRYGRLAVQLAERDGDTTMQICTIYFRLSGSFFSAHENDSSDLYVSKALKVALKYPEDHEGVIVLRGYCKTLYRKQKWQDAIDMAQYCEGRMTRHNLFDSITLFTIYANAYTGQKKYKEAKRYADDLVVILRRIGPDHQFNPNIYRCLMNYNRAIGDYRASHDYAAQLVRYCIEDSSVEIATSYMYLSSADSLLGDMPGALAAYKECKRWSDIQTGEAKKMQLSQLQIQYETDQKDKDLKFKQQDIELLTNKNQLQDANIRKATLLRNMIILAAFLLLTIAWIGYRVKQRHNTRLEAQQEEIHGQNEQLKELLNAQKKLVTEKEWLVREIHHRVKNNLQIIISLLNAQAEFLHDPSALDAIRGSRERMQAVALIHQKLYQPDHSTLISMRSYIGEMVTYLSSSFADSGRIRFVMEVDDIDLDVSQSVPLGLILNEAITNAMKYAFPAGSKGAISIWLREVNGEEILMRVKDDGRGFPEGFDISGRASLGVQLIRLFSEQLDGELDLRSGGGVEISLLFKRAKAGA